MWSKNILLIFIFVIVFGTAFVVLDRIYWQAQPVIKKQLPPTPKQTTITTRPVTIKGTMTCLPHKNTNGPQTMECVFGLKDDMGNYYALQDTDPQYKHLSIATGKRVEIIGTFTPQDNPKYQSIGIIEITDLTPL